MYRRYNRILLLWFAGGMAIFVAIAAWLEPNTGDLTRLGSYSENNYGWNGEELVFDPPRAAAGQLDGRYDIIVVGDSFSLRTTPDRQTQYGGFWTDFLADATGLSVGVFEADATPIDTLLASSAMRNDPPRLMVIEVVERELLRFSVHYSGLSGDCGSIPGAIPLLLPRAKMPSGPLARRRVLTPGVAHGKQVVGFIQTNLWRGVSGRDGTDVRLLALTRDDLFTSRRSGALLAYRHDADRMAWPPDAWGRIFCGLAVLQARVQAAGRTKLLVVIAPDKSTAYAPYLAAEDRLIDATPHLAAWPGLNLVRADLALRREITRGVRDVYLPNDTHWGTAGSWAVAKAVIAHANGAHANGVPDE